MANRKKSNKKKKTTTYKKKTNFYDINDDELKTNIDVLEDDDIKETKKEKLKEYDLYSDEEIIISKNNKKSNSKKKTYIRGENQMANKSKKKQSKTNNLKKKFKQGSIKDKILIILMLGLIGIFSLIVVFCLFIIITAPEVTEQKLYKKDATVILDSEGKEIKRLGAENRENITYDDLPEVLVDAIIATEDSRFFQHNGVDFARFSKAVIGQLMGQSDAGGASTLTMQVSKNVATSNVSHGIKGIIRKFTDVYVSIFKLEKKYTKEQILEFYVNIHNLGAGAYGVEQASKIYFGKSVSELNLTEAALIAGIFQAPSAYNPYVYPEKCEQRRNIVLNLMERHGYITEEERDAAKEVPVKSLLIGHEGSNLSEYVGFIDTVVEDVIKRTGDDPYTVPMIIYTTLDTKRQDAINDLYNTYKWRNKKSQAGIAVVDVETGAIVAVGAGRNKTSERSFNLATSARRHPGSTAKPVIDYGPAIEYLNWGSGQTVIDDTYKYTNGGYVRNHDYGYYGIMTIKRALAQSRNIPALYTFQQTTNEQKKEFISNLGWKPEMSDGTILETCSIGGFTGVTPIESASAYAAFARGGTYIEPFTFTKIEYQDRDEVYKPKIKKVQAMSEETAYIITMILKSAVTSGSVGASSVSGTEIAGKTGTSTVDPAVKKEKGITGGIIGDSWEILYTTDYAISLWYGYEKITKDYYLKPTEGSQERRSISKILSKKIFKKNAKFKKPKGITTATIELETDPLELASKYTPSKFKSKEYFKKGYAPKSVSNRFDQLDNASNLVYTPTGIGGNITWDAAPLPDAINKEYLKEYFNKSTLYKHWGTKYYNRRIKYNTNTFGDFGYYIYVTSPSGITTTLDFTTNTNYQIVTPLELGSTITVKTSYKKFKSNQSDGITTTVSNTTTSTQTDNNSTTTNITTQEEDTSFTIQYKGSSCSTKEEYESLGPKPEDKIVVLSNGHDVTEDAIISIDEDSIDDNIVLFTVRYKGTTKNKQLILDSSC